MLQALSGTMGGSEALPKQRRLSKRAIAVAGVAAVGVGRRRVSGEGLDYKARSNGTATATYDSYTEAEELLVRYDKPGNTEKAVKLLEEATKKDDTFALGWAELGHAYWREYLTTQDAALVQKALAACKKALVLNPNLALVQSTMGVIHVVANKNMDLGMEELQRAAQLNGNNPEILANLAEGYRRANRPDEAKAALQRAIDLAPDDWRWPHLMASQEIRTGDFKNAEEHSTQAIKLTPDNGMAFYNLAIAEQSEGRNADAEKDFEKAVRYTPTYFPLIALANLYTWEGKYPEAAAMIERALNLTSSDYKAWASLAVAYDWNPATKVKAQEAREHAIKLLQEKRQIEPKNARLLGLLADEYAGRQTCEQEYPAAARGDRARPG